jgi:hypothetical protein
MITGDLSSQTASGVRSCRSPRTRTRRSVHPCRDTGRHQTHAILGRRWLPSPVLAAVPAQRDGDAFARQPRTSVCCLRQDVNQPAGSHLAPGRSQPQPLCPISDVTAH